MPLRIELTSTLTLGFCLGLLGSCFAGDFAHGHPCSSDSDCGPTLECVEGLCGGPGGAGLCGNGLLDLGEACDDGNILDGDGCSASCDFCGDGVVDAGEECDDGNNLDGDFCTPVCRTPVCGDGFASPLEACDDGNLAGDDACTPACTLPDCGDGFINVVGEACDDGNSVETDTCTSGCSLSPELPALALNLAPVKQFELSWSARGSATYRLFERVNADAAWEPIAEGTTESFTHESFTHTVPLHQRGEASYYLEACNAGSVRCVDSNIVEVEGDLSDAIGQMTTSYSDNRDYFGVSVALAGDGQLLVVGAPWEDSAPLGLTDSDPSDNSRKSAGAAYVFARDEAGWSAQAFLKASTAGQAHEIGERFGSSLALSADSNTLAISAPWELSADNSGGAVYVFVREGGGWVEQARLQGALDATSQFGWGLALSEHGDTLAVGAGAEANSGAVYLFTREGQSWSQQARIVGSNTEAADGFGGAWPFIGAPPPFNDTPFQDNGNLWFGGGVALSADGDTLAVTAIGEASSSALDQEDNSVVRAGAAYVFAREGESWSQTAYLKAPDPSAGAYFGADIALSGDGDTLVVGAYGELELRGAAYVFVREGESWASTARLEAPNAEVWDQFGMYVTLSSDGQLLAISAPGEDGITTGINGDQDKDTAGNYRMGAGYVFVREGESWSFTTYLKPPTLTAGLGALAMSANGDTLAFGSAFEVAYLY